METSNYRIPTRRELEQQLAAANTRAEKYKKQFKTKEQSLNDILNHAVLLREILNPFQIQEDRDYCFLTWDRFDQGQDDHVTETVCEISKDAARFIKLINRVENCPHPNPLPVGEGKESGI